jgi:signal transduction histidine kinase
MTLRSRLVLWYSAILLGGLLLIAGWAYYEMVVERGTRVRTAEHEDPPLEEFGEVMLYGGLPALILAVIGGWFLMRRALSPITMLTRAIERVQADALNRQLTCNGSGDELDHLAEVFNSMINRLSQSFARSREFTLNASHELKTPLTVLRGEIEMKLREPALPDKEREYFAAQLDEVIRLARIVDSLALLAKVDAGKLTVAREAIRFDELVRDNFEDTRMLARDSGIQVGLSVCEKITVLGDRHRLRQLMLNLTDNAIKYNQANGQIYIALTRHKDDAELTIANTGPGIPPEKLPRIFDRFYRCDPSHNNDIEGCGLGLSIVQWIVKAHGGMISFASEPGKLTTVTVRLPMQKGEGDSTAKAIGSRIEGLNRETSFALPGSLKILH